MGAGADGAESVRRETTEKMYGCVDGDTCGSPAELTGNLRERLEERERRKTGTEAGFDRANSVD